MSIAVSEGFCSEDPAKKTPGKVCHARWLTAACRILRLYVTMEYPSDELVQLVTFIQKVYAPMWFQIKVNHSVQDGAYNLWKTIHLSRYLSENLKAIVDPVIQHDGFYGHPENILITMVGDEREEIRQEAWVRIVEARAHKSEIPRSFHVSKFNFEANDYSSLINWNTTNVTEPPVLLSLTDAQLKKLKDDSCTFVIKNFPCHTQAVERYVTKSHLRPQRPKLMKIGTSRYLLKRFKAGRKCRS